jgi:hypothetical protein
MVGTTLASSIAQFKTAVPRRLPSARQYVRIYERFGDSAHRPQLESLFNIGELAVLAACTDDVLEEAIALKEANPGLTRNQLRQYLQEKNPR